MDRWMDNCALRRKPTVARRERLAGYRLAGSLATEGGLQVKGPLFAEERALDQVRWSARPAEVERAGTETGSRPARPPEAEP